MLATYRVHSSRAVRVVIELALISLALAVGVRLAVLTDSTSASSLLSSVTGQETPKQTTPTPHPPPEPVEVFVTNSADEGPGSLRQAIRDANSSLAPAWISFQVPHNDPGFVDGVLTIRPVTPLPELVGSHITVDGDTQIRFTGSSNGGHPVIVLNGQNVPRATGLVVTGNKNTIRRLVVNGFDGIGQSAIAMRGSHHTRVQGCYLGTNAIGTESVPNDSGLLILAGAQDTLIGGTREGEGNLISGNTNDGILITGTDTFRTTVRGNRVGLTSNDLPLGNGGNGVLIASSPQNLVGGVESGDANEIAYNGQSGIAVTGASALANRFHRNSIHANGRLGIDLDDDNANLKEHSPRAALPNFPLLRDVRQEGAITLIDGLVETRAGEVLIEFYVSLTCSRSDHGEGEKYLTSALVMAATDSSPLVRFSVRVPAIVKNGFVTATSTSARGTSEFSPCLMFSAPPAVHLTPDVTVIGGRFSTLDESTSNERHAGINDLGPAPGKPDLVVRDLSVQPATMVAGNPVALSFKLVNQGQRTAAAATHEIRLTSNPVLNSAATLLATFKTRPVPPGRTIEYPALAATIPPSLFGSFMIGIVLDARGQVDEADETNNIASTPLTVLRPNSPPIAVAGPDRTANEGDSLTFDGSASTDPDGDPLAYRWDFGDGTTASGIRVQHAYRDNGIFMVRLLVDDGKAQAMGTATITVKNVPPTVKPGPDQDGQLGLELRFNGSFTDPAGDADAPYKIEWDFGDNTKAQGALNPTHSYNAGGVYRVTLLVTDKDGGAGRDGLTVRINVPPIVNLKVDRTELNEGEEVSFDGSESSDADGMVVSYAWSFGDGTTGTGAKVTHRYGDNAVLTASLTVTDNKGGTARATVTIRVNNVPPTVRAGPDQEGQVGQDLRFNGSFTDPAGNADAPYKVEWDFGDGTKVQGTQSPTHGFSAGGTYKVILTVADKDGGVGTGTLTARINSPPRASLRSDRTEVNEGDRVNFDGSGSSDSDGTVIAYAWDFGDGTTDSGAQVLHRFGDNGVWSVTLTVTDNKGGIGKATTTIRVNNVPPTVVIPPTQEVVVNQAVLLSGQFTDPGLRDGPFTITWDFGDGSQAAQMVTEPGPITQTHTYPRAAIYSATLRVTDKDSGFGTALSKITVRERADLVASNLSIDRTQVEPGGSIQLSFTVANRGLGPARLTFHLVRLSTMPDNPLANFPSTRSLGPGESEMFKDRILRIPDNAPRGPAKITVIADGLDLILETDKTNNSASADITILGGNQNPIACITAPRPGQAWDEGQEIAFDGSCSRDPDGSIKSYFWNFGDLQGTPEQKATHRYRDNGDYVATLTVTDDKRADANVSMQMMIRNVSPAVNAGADQTVRVGETVQFKGTYTDPGGDADGPYRIQWDFGDGIRTAIGSGVSLTQAHVYDVPATYTVTLMVTDKDRGEGRGSLKVTVRPPVRPPVADPGPGSRTVNEAQELTFDGSESRDPDPARRIVAHEWNFGDGTPSGSGVRVTHRYIDDGIYTVTLTVTNDQGVTGRATVTVRVNNVSPTVTIENIQAAVVGSGARLQGSFTDPAGEADRPYQIQWDFGDESRTPLSPETSLAPMHIYTREGTYTVKLLVVDKDGGPGDATARITVVRIRPPIADPGPSSRTANEGQELAFDGSASRDPEGRVVAYEWNFGDRSPVVSGARVAHRYADSGTYLATLTVTNDRQAKADATVTVTVNNVRPTVSLGSDQDVLVDTEVRFQGTFTDPAGDADRPYKIQWDFGDGTKTPSSPDTSLTQSHVYRQEGILTVMLLVIDKDGGEGSASSKVTVRRIRPPVADAGLASRMANEGEEMVFDGSGSRDPDPERRIMAYEWNFGDGAPLVRGIQVTHRYADNGRYTATLTVTNDRDLKGTASVAVTINNVSPAVSIGQEQTVLTNEVVRFQGSFIDPGGDADAPYKLQWDFGDGQRTLLSADVRLSQVHVYDREGVYPVSLLVVDKDGGEGRGTSKVTVFRIRPPIADPGPISRTANEGQEVAFDGSASRDPEGRVVAYEWNFGDRTPVVPGAIVTHRYADNGNGPYTVTLTVTNDRQAKGEATVTVTVNNVSPDVRIGPDQTVLADTVVRLQGSFTDPAGDADRPYQIQWDFGDGAKTALSPETGLTQTHVYTQEGIFPVTLLVVDKDGGAGSRMSKVTVRRVRPPIADPGPISRTADEGQELAFDGSASRDPEGRVVAYEWNFGDRTPVVGGAKVTHRYADNAVYKATLVVTNDQGAKGEATVTVTINNVAPAVTAGRDQDVLLGTMVRLQGSFTDPAGDADRPYRVQWDFGDGQKTTLSPETNLTQTHVYNSEGIYTVVLLVVDKDGGVGRSELKVTVRRVRPPIADPGQTSRSANEGEEIAFDGSGSRDPEGGQVVTYDWSFGDGTPAAKGVRVTHGYVDNGLYTVTLTVTTDRGVKGDATVKVTVNNLPPVVTVGPDTAVQVKSAVQLSGSFTDPGTADTHVIEWDFGDGSKVKDVLNPLHTYSAIGKYTVVLTVTDKDGGKGSDAFSVYVFDAPARPSSPPDLIIRNLRVQPSLIIQGNPVRLSFEIVNQGVGVAAPAIHEIRFSSDGVIDRNDIVLATVKTGPLPFDRATAFTVELDLPNDRPGRFFIGVIADANRQVGESDETNNTAIIAVTIRSDREMP